MDKETKDKILDIVCNISETAIGVPIIDPLMKALKLYYTKSMENKWKLFLNYAIEMEKFCKEIKDNPHFLDYLSDYFESIRKTPSLLAIKTMALIFRDFQADKKVQQRTCRVFAEITDDELEFFKFVYNHIQEFEESYNSKKNPNNIVRINDILGKKLEIDNENEDIRYYLTELNSRNFLILFKPAGSWSNEFEHQGIKLTNTSKLYFEYITKAERPEYQHIGSIIKKDKNK
ncbi:MAG: hypothetical protein PHY80_01670 [Rickettsiales bacterium]|nr:hypothetical protein [Rickettsiales bacterium]